MENVTNYKQKKNKTKQNKLFFKIKKKFKIQKYSQFTFVLRPAPVPVVSDLLNNAFLDGEVSSISESRSEVYRMIAKFVSICDSTFFGKIPNLPNRRNLRRHRNVSSNSLKQNPYHHRGSALSYCPFSAALEGKNRENSETLTQFCTNFTLQSN